MISRSRISRRTVLGAGISAPFVLRASSLAAQTQSTDELTALSVAEASTQLRRGSLSPIQLVEAYLERIERLEGRINAYITVTAEEALEQARRYARELEMNQWRGPLHGVPIAIKDNIDTAGIPTTAASSLLRDRIPQADAPAYRRLKEAGAILLGKLNMHEFAYGGTSSISLAGPVRNPWDTNHIPGGSSGGSAAAVAASLCCAALGTDTLASVRLPAAYCGITGLKPSHGLSSIRGIIPVSESLDHVGPMTKTVEDCAILLREMAGYDPRDPVSIQAPEVDYLAAMQRPTSGMRIGIPRSPYYDDLHSDVAAAMEEALEVLGMLAGEIRDVTLPDPGNFEPILAESYVWHESYIASSRDRRHYDNSTLDRIVAAGQTPVEDYISARHEMVLARQAIANVFREVDILVTPTAPGLPEPIDNAIVADASGAEPSVRNTAPFNLYGIPTISVPCGFSSDGLPIGLQISAAHLEESALFAMAHAYQQVTEWHLRRPELG